jgi:8-oxo-dGTP pyrophosphatase MutT (NUDIX family)
VTEYVLCFVKHEQEVLLIVKAKPDWQRGLMNLPGGKIEPGETPIQAANRELLEETNLVSHYTTELGVIEGEGWRVHVVGCCVADVHRWRSMTDEPIRWVPIHHAVALPDIIPNLRIIIPLAAYTVRGWVMREEGCNYTCAFPRT